MTETTLVLLRHAKAAQTDEGEDIDRPLTTRGHGDAAAAGAWLLRRGLVPAHVLCSPARRTRQTWHAVAVALAEAAQPAAAYRAEIYDSTPGTLLSLLQELPDDAGTVLLIGHNPTVTGLSALLAPSSATPALRTAGIAVHRPRVPWSRLGPGDAALAELYTARG
ncbi:SixA phosphatase family protein [Pilimelia terevasa]|uniref:SixA phosphatase family protein n=1 Tax=Pilimelia terevasa TaxID=53372 RepID=UPI0016697B35|nr:histidine phosphatase family protein [Pilimelia terevasa]